MRSLAGGPPPRILLTEDEAAASLGISARKFAELRDEPWMAACRPIVLGPRLLRWSLTELQDAVARMPRQASATPEPLELAKARAARGGRCEVNR